MKLRLTRPLLLWLAFCLIQGFLVGNAFALDLPKGVTQVTEVEGITEYRLENGLRVLLFPDASKPTVTVNITYLVGSRHEHYGETGMAHLLEHLLFKDTERFQDIPGAMKKRGINFNATTWLDRTNYFSSFAADEDTLNWLLDLEADRMLNSPLQRSDLDSEMTVVRNEMEAGENSPVGSLIERITSIAFMWHNYGNSTIGARADVENMPIERLQAFYRRHYRPDNATLLVAGRIEPAAVLSKIVDRFAELKAPSTPLEITYTREPPQDGERSVTVRRVGETRYLGFGYHTPAATDADYAPLSLAVNILGDTPTGRLHKTLVEGKLATFVGAFSFGLIEPGFSMFLAEAPKDGDFDALREKMQGLIEQVAEQPFTEQELTDAKRRTSKAIELTMNDANRLALALSESVAQGDWRMFFLNRDRAEAATLDDVNRVASAYFKRSNRNFGQFIPTQKPDRVEIAEAPRAAELLKGYKGRAAIAAGEAFDPSPANIDARTESAKLTNGTELRLLSKATRGNTVVLNAVFRYGDLDSVMHKSSAADFAAAMLMRGTHTRSREDIARRFDELKARVSIGGGVQSLTVSVQTTRANLPAVMELVAEVLQQPSFPEAEFEQLRSQSITGVESQLTEPQAIASNAMSRHFNHYPKGHPRYAETFEEQLTALRALSLEEVKAFHQRFHGAGDGEIAVVGDFDPTETETLLQGLFGNWQRGVAFVRIDNPYQPTETAKLRENTPDKPNALWLARSEMPMNDQHPDYPALSVASYVFGGGSLKSRLADRIRQRDGLSYGVGASFSASAQDDNAMLMAYAIAAPENIDKVDAAFAEEWDLMLKQGISKDELKDAVEGMLRARERARGEDPSLVSALQSNAYLGRDMSWSAKFDQALRSLDVATVNTAIRQHWSKLAFTTSAAGDFEKAGKQ
ncbi:M16 family metallopeptidase [Pseudomarimonas arenosa]|uniref:Insulinase family protein n=1 Tax=Pseudomarimonas arenosa TaxID=2774145 RepID=A0AAW3ZL94_9GAMM|nr:pitrilysin family protein [Pseudomarimonas arenosa]MBD8526508.1 insulinase family protein [Pseudomarimonas arenosa]